MYKRIPLFLFIILCLAFSNSHASEVVIHCNEDSLVIDYLSPNGPYKKSNSNTVNNWDLVKCEGLPDEQYCDGISVLKTCNASQHRQKLIIKLTGNVFNSRTSGSCGAADPYVTLTVKANDNRILFSSELEKNWKDRCGEVTKYIDTVTVNQSPSQVTTHVTRTSD